MGRLEWALVMALILNLCITTYINMNYKNQDTSDPRWVLFFLVQGAATFLFSLLFIRTFF